MTAAQPYMTVSRRPLDLEDYINVARRHSGWIIGPLFAGLVISVVVAFCWPNTYQAQAVMEITPSRVAGLVQSTLTQQLNERILQMENNIMSRQSLANLINQPNLNLYKEERLKEPLDDVEDEMREAIKITVNPEMVLSKNGASTFSIAFSYRSRKGAVDTVNALISRFIQESTNTQRDQQDTVQSLVSDEVAQAKADLERENEALTKFRKDNEGRLPEEEGMNIQSLQSLQTQLTGVNQDLQQLANNRLTIESQITQLESQLKLSQSMAQDFAEMAPLPTGAVARQNDQLLALNKQIEHDELLLQQLKQTFKPSYPDIRNLESSLTVMRQKRDELTQKQAQDQTADSAKPKEAPRKVTNYKALENEAQIQAQIAHYQTLLTNIDRDRDFRLKQQEDFNKQINDYRTRLAATSLIEAEYADLKRDQAAAATKYEKYESEKDLTTQSEQLISRHAT